MQHQTIEAVAAVPTILCDRAALSAALKTLGAIIERRNTIPILSGVLVEPIGDGGIRLIGTDLDIRAAVEVPCDVRDGVAFVAADCKALSDALKACTGETVMLELDGASLRISSGGAGMKLATFPVDDFPGMVPGEALATIEFDGATLAQDLARIGPCVSTEETRYYLNGVFFHAGYDPHAPFPAVQRRAPPKHYYGLPTRAKRRIERDAERLGRIETYLKARRDRPRFEPVNYFAMAATDGHRMAVQRRALDASAVELPSTIVPRKLVGFMAKLLGKPSPRNNPGAMVLGFNRATVRVRFGRWDIVAKVIDGTFPDYTRVIPTDVGDRVAIAQPEQLAAAVKAATAVCTDRVRAVRLDFDGAKVTAFCNDPDKGTATADAPCDWAGDGPFAIGFNASYLVAACDAFAGHHVSLGFSDAAGPALLQTAGLPDFKLILMPMRCDAAPPAASASTPAHPVESAYERFKRVYTAAYAARDSEGMRREVDAYRAYLASDNPRIGERERRAEIVLLARRHRGQPERARDDLRHKAATFETRFDPANPHVGRTLSDMRPAGHFWKLNVAAASVERLRALPGYDPADVRDVIPLKLDSGRTVHVLGSDLRSIAVPVLLRCEADGTPKVLRGGSRPLVYRQDIAAIIPPKPVKLSAEETAGKLAVVEAENIAMRDRMAVLESLVADLAARPAVIAAPEPQPEPVAAVVEPEPQPVPEPVQAPEPTVLGAIIADLATRLERAEAQVARYQRQRSDTALRMRDLRRNKLMYRGKAAQLRTELLETAGRYNEEAERVGTLVTRVNAADAELARLRPLAAAIQALASPMPAMAIPEVAAFAALPAPVEA